MTAQELETILARMDCTSRVPPEIETMTFEELEAVTNRLRRLYDADYARIMRRFSAILF